MAKPTKAKALERLQKVLDEIPKLKELPRRSTKFKKWHRDTKTVISNTFAGETNHLQDFEKIHYSPTVIYSGMHESEYQQGYENGLESAGAVLESMIDEIKEYWEEGSQSSEVSTPKVNTPEITNKIFIIHGRDNSAKATVARFLEHLELEVIILHEQPNKGRTIIEKFEDYADVKFAVVLLTPDDVGALKEQDNDYKSRARQNVVFEFGYFIGRLGRKNVCALLKGDVEKPSDCDGIIYIPLDDNDGWQLPLLRELRAAGFKIDANQVI